MVRGESRFIVRAVFIRAEFILLAFIAALDFYHPYTVPYIFNGSNSILSGICKLLRLVHCLPLLAVCFINDT